MTRKVDYIRNHETIRNAVLSYLQANKGVKSPTYSELQEMTGLSRQTLVTHFKEIKFEPLNNHLRSLTNEVILSIFLAARKGSVNAQKLWLQVMEGWSEISNVNIQGDFNFNEPMIPKTDEQKAKYYEYMQLFE